MPDSLISTKLNIPRTRRWLVHRPRLIERMHAGLGGKLTIVSAPAGYGKTTLVAEWIAQLKGKKESSKTGERPTGLSQFYGEMPTKIAWLTLEKTDNEVARFFSYLIATLQRIDPTIGIEVQSILEADVDVPVESLLTALVNEIASSEAAQPISRRDILVLDDYHSISEFRIHEALDFLIDHIPQGMHLVIIGRTDPPMPLGRLRVQQELTEIRETDLQFTIDETTTFFNEFMGFDLSVEDIQRLDARTEGWIAGLQLAALTLRGRRDQRDQIATISGSHRHLIDYLAHEVMSRQSKEVQSFLLRTSILERFNASLCEAIMEISGSREHPSHDRELLSSFKPSKAEVFQPGSDPHLILAYLEAANLFLVALDNKRHWYRYHHLFRDFLRQHLIKIQPELVPELTIRASQWYEEQGMVDEAINHALTGGDMVRCARLLDDNVAAYIHNAEVLKIMRWANKLPMAVRARFPRLCIYHAWALQFELRLDSVEPVLALAETHLPNPGIQSKNFTKHELLGHAKAIRAYTAVRNWDPFQAIALSKSALEELPKEETNELLTVAGAAWLGLGIAHQELGQVEDAAQSFNTALPINQQAGNHYGILSCLTQLLQLNTARGKLSQAAANFKTGLLWIEEWSGAGELPRRPVRMLAYLRLLMSEIQYEWNDLQEALTNLQKAYDYYDLAKSWYRFVCQVNFVELHQALGDVEKALEWLHKLQRISRGTDHALRGVPIAVWIAERCLLLSQWRPDLNDLCAEALYWAKDSGLQPGDDFTGEREHEYVLLTKVLIVENRGERAIPLLERLSQSAEHTGRWGDLINILLLQMLAHKSLDNMALAISYLSRALELAEPEGYIRTFIDHGPPMRDSLQLAAQKGISPLYIDKLLAAFPINASHGPTLSVSQSSSIAELEFEPLNDREMQIIRLMAARLSNREIAEELYLSVNTVKWYARSIFDKLGVSNRRDAGARARQLGIL